MILVRLVGLLVVGFLAWLMQLGGAGMGTSGDVHVAFMLGFILLAAHLVGLLVERVRLPGITGYLVTGLLFGPHIVGLLTLEVQEGMSVFVEMSFAFIGLAAGTELHLAVLRQRARSVILIIVVSVAVVFVGVTGVMAAMNAWLPGMAGRSVLGVLAVCSLLGIIAAARSPSSVIAIIDETHAKGPFTETVLGVNMAIDLIILPLFFLTLALARVAVTPDASLDVAVFGILTAEIVGSVVVGAVLGAGVAYYIRREGPQLALVLVGLCYAVYRSTSALELTLAADFGIHLTLEPLLICATAGFVVRNASPHGAKLAHAMGSVGLPVYVVFFTMAGAALDLRALAASWVLALVLATTRGGMLLLGTGLATRLAGDSPLFRRHCWKGFVTQAGLSIALAGEIAAAFPDWGPALALLLIAAIAVNQLVGPILFKQALERVGETRAARRARARESPR